MYLRVQASAVFCSFAMTINKAQGQSLTVAGVDLTEPCFSHGQLYVALSRVGSPSGLFVYAPDRRTKNVVYTDALPWLRYCVVSIFQNHVC